MTPMYRYSFVSLMALGLALPMAAQEVQQTVDLAEPTSGPQEGGPQESGAQQRARDVVIITAQKREETVQDIAAAVTAVTSEMRDEIGLTTVQDYTNFAPGLTYSTSNDRLGMRGVTRTSNNFGIRSGISNYVDGVYFSSAIPASREPIFTDRVEVVRGPQGTLYGRDSIGGALNVISKRPTDTFEGQFNMGFGNYETRKVEMTMAGPINDSLRYRVGGSRTVQDEGYFTNVSGLETEGGRNDGYYLEAQLEGDIGERFDWWLRYGSLQWKRYGAPGARTGVGALAPYDTQFFNSTADIGPNGWFGLSDPNAVNMGNVTSNPALNDPWSFAADFSAFAYLEPTTEIAAEATYSFDNFDVKYLGGYVWYNYNLQQDQDGTSISQYTMPSGKVIESARVSDYNEHRGWFSNEINFISTGDGPLNWVAGAYQYQENYTQPTWTQNVVDPGGPVYDIGELQTWLNNGLMTAPPTNMPVPPSGTGRTSASGAPMDGASMVFFTNNDAINNAYGLFFQGDYAINDQWKVTAGLRWSKDVMSTRETARIINHYVVEAALEAGYAPFYGAFTPGLIPVKVDVTSTLGGADPSTIGTLGPDFGSGPCGIAGKGVVNLNPNPTSCADKTQFGIYYDPATGNSYRDMHATWQEVTGVLGIDWTPDDDTLIYGKYNRGYKPGGLGASQVYGLLAPTPYTDKELVDAFELGFKREWPAWNLTTNAVAFYYDYQGYQVSNAVIPPEPSDPTAVRPSAYTAYVNLPETTTSGFELETIWRPTDAMRILLNYGWTNPEIGSLGDLAPLIHSLDPYALDPAAQPAGAAASDGRQGQSLDGNILPFSPKNKIALNGTYTWDFEDNSTLTASLSYFWQDIAYSSIFNRSYTKIPSWDQTDARLSWTNGDGNITLIGFVKNMFDEVGYDSRGAGLREGSTNKDVAPTLCYTSPATTAAFGSKPMDSCYTTSETYRPPRTWGAELQFRF